MASFRGHKKLEPHPDGLPLGVKFKISDEHPRLSVPYGNPPRVLFMSFNLVNLTLMLHLSPGVWEQSYVISQQILKSPSLVRSNDSTL